MTNIQANTDKSKVKKTSSNPAAATQSHLRVAEIQANTVILKNGAVRAVLEVNSINFSLKSEPEQESIIAGYQSFLNTLEFPVQILIQSKKIDLDHYIEDIRKKGESHQNPLLKRQTLEYAEYIHRLLEYVDIMDKKFYVIVPYESLITQKSNMFTKFLERLKQQEGRADFLKRKKNFEKLTQNLESRVATVMSGLENCGLKVERLDTKQLIKMYYGSYNPVLSRQQKLTNEIIDKVKKD